MSEFKRGALPQAPKIILSENIVAHAATNNLGEDFYRRVALAQMWHRQEAVNALSNLSISSTGFQSGRTAG